VCIIYCIHETEMQIPSHTHTHTHISSCVVLLHFVSSRGGALHGCTVPSPQPLAIGHLLIYAHPSLPLPCCLRMFTFMIHFVLYTRLTPIGGGIPEMQAYYTSFGTLRFEKECAHHTLGLGHYRRRPNVNGQVENEHK
jgi:hypothetical protein